MKGYLLLLPMLTVLSSHVAQAAATRYPVTIESCNRTVTFEAPPQRAVSNDVNLTSMMVALGLQKNMVGYTGISGWNKPTPELLSRLAGLRELASKYPSIETLLNADADFYFAGWNYGMRVGGDVTPQTLASMGIQAYELTESCAQIMARKSAALEDVYRDLINLGKIFDVEDKAETLVADMQRSLNDVRTRVAGKPTPRVFLYDSGEDRPMTAGRLAVPQALISAAGGRNVMDSVNASWTHVNWESVVASDPEVIVIVDYGEVSAAQKKHFLETNPALQSISAIRHHRYIVLPYVAVTPGIDNIAAVQALAAGLHGVTP
ncbi:ABC transporter substrate-binding protein [Pseudomonas huanghezhanensis]|uniref:ABC transporter substrate-binding protein n=1 Tax=Pseudomonas huanghezhanensis TaxID=3002903 RepID=UPI002285B910|nr:ABC transporter substrate-binding protein [Pseudomonas sp. BSw22131]